MKTTLCTLFNINYLDKGLVLYDSLERVAEDFVLYVLAMDDRCYDILSDIDKPFLIPIKLSDFENDELLKAKANRTFGEYCWTCSSALILYILQTYNPRNCTYIDADMYFYSDPQVLIDEMYDNKASVLVVGHRYLKSLEKALIYYNGRFCVQFNTFNNDENGRMLLRKWHNQCLECCTHITGICCGDQKYLDNWCEDYSFVHETTNMGAGVAPWNLSQYKLISCEDGKVAVRCHSKTFKIVFYHFEGMTYITERTVNTHTYTHWGEDGRLINLLYSDYVKRLAFKKKFIEEHYGFNYIMRAHPAVKEQGPLKISERIRNLLSRLRLPGGFNYLIFRRLPMAIYKSRGILTIE